MKRWKLLPLGMAVAMAAVTPIQVFAESPEWAHTDEEWAKLRDNVMEYDELEGLVHEYNPAVVNNRLKYANSDYKNKSSQEIADMLYDAANSARRSMDSVDAMTGGIDAMADVMSDSIEAQAKQLEMQAQQNTTDDTIIRLQYDMAEATVASAVENLMNQYNQTLGSKRVLEQNRVLALAAYDSAVTRFELKMATQADVLNAKQQVQELDAKIIAIDSGINSMKQNLCLMTGWSFDANPEILSIPASDLSRIDSMNLEADIAKARENNYTLKIQRRQKDNTASSYADMELLEKNIANGEQKLATEMTKQYQAVIQAKADYEDAVSALELETKKMGRADIEYQNGTKSRMEYLQQQAGFVGKQVDKETKDMLLFQAMETYDWMVRGLATISQ